MIPEGGEAVLFHADLEDTDSFGARTFCESHFLGDDCVSLLRSRVRQALHERKRLVMTSLIDAEADSARQGIFMQGAPRTSAAHVFSNYYY